MAPGGIIPQAGNAVYYETGGWRTYRPVRDDDKCIDCLFCWIYCPDDSIIMRDESVKGLGFDLDHCKGCGICAAVCPTNCIEMKLETELRDQPSGAEAADSGE
ncbi:MAG: 4Fe-4S binding protein [Armatimonadetes bacterium]|nr:4Fe-4S binding protein [Armatimonadota bacterium]